MGIARFTAAFFSILVVILLGTWFVQGSGFFLYRWLAPHEEQVRRETFEQSKAYNQGMIQELQNLWFEYVQADVAHQQALGAIILHRAADYDTAKLPADLRQFIDNLRRERTGATP